jgi:hypothetical protein
LFMSVRVALKNGSFLRLYREPFQAFTLALFSIQFLALKLSFLP